MHVWDDQIKLSKTEKKCARGRPPSYTVKISCILFSSRKVTMPQGADHTFFQENFPEQSSQRELTSRQGNTPTYVYAQMITVERRLIAPLKLIQYSAKAQEYWYRNTYQRFRNSLCFVPTPFQLCSEKPFVRFFFFCPLLLLHNHI